MMTGLFDRIWMRFKIQDSRFKIQDRRLHSEFV